MKSNIDEQNNGVIIKNHIYAMQDRAGQMGLTCHSHSPPLRLLVFKATMIFRTLPHVDKAAASLTSKR